ncbi:hypothetical protein FC75_GL001450 [Lacticaseibacillus camelliae DSM 22697 = JCM 13995]|uniref:Uncharacterized protein n=2 Tax=Lacticaseibacillus camelliae TaxID=381742 RepID=A0A0R2FFE4_9LACO|nr:hypothetical protein FC75_GL001450 [Lacticaseibacillus camelliae DSM 22697 = JCM 13995]
MLSDKDFKDGFLDPNIVEKLKKGNLDKNGNKVNRPFITISAKNSPKLLNELCKQVGDYLKDNSLKGSGLFAKVVNYLNDEDYKKAELYEENNISKINGIFINNDTKMISRSSITDTSLQSILHFLYLVKPAYFEDQREYRVGLALDDSIDANELLIPIHDLTKYVKVHKSQDINNLRLGDI